MKMCKDCKWAKKSWFPNFWNPMMYAKCLKTICPATGEPKNYCLIRRNFACGPEGKDFESKMS